jgi:hypothetical protein
MEFIAPDPNALVRAANVRATLDAFQLRPSLGQRLIERHSLQLTDLRPENFILVQRWLDALKEIQEEIGGGLVHRVGMAILQNADFPPQFDSIDALFANMDAIYYLNHKGDVGHYHTKKSSEGVWTIECATPYPRQFEHGAVEGVCRNPAFTKGKGYVVNYEDGPAGSDVTCIMKVRPL